MNKTSGALVLLGEFVKNPMQIGSVIPSSRFLKRRIIRSADTDNANVVVELGPGDGGTTQSILDSMHPDAKLLAIELNDGLYKRVSGIKDSRLIVHHGNASDIESILQHYNLAKPDVVISGIPFSCIDKNMGAAIIEKIHELLIPGGRFVAYQLNPRVSRLNTFFDKTQKTVELEWLSIPPFIVWRWKKI